MSLTNPSERATQTVPVSSAGSYRAVTFVNPMRSVDLQLSSLRHEIAHLELLRNQITHAQSVMALVNPSTPNGEQSDFVTLVFPGRAHLPNHVKVGGAAETFVGAVVSVLPNMPMQPTFVASTDGFTTYNVTFSPSARIRQYTAVLPFQDAGQYVLPDVLPESGASPSESAGIQSSTSGESPEGGNTPTTFVELRLDAEQLAKLDIPVTAARRDLEAAQAEAKATPHGTKKSAARGN